MARLATWGWEWGNDSGDFSNISVSLPGQTAVGAAARTGNYGLRKQSTDFGTSIQGLSTLVLTTLTNYWFRVYFRKSGNVSAQTMFLQIARSGGAPYSLELDTAGKIVLEVPDGTSRGTSANALSDNVWYRIEAFFNFDVAGTSDQIDVRVDGSSVLSGTFDGNTTVPIDRFSFGRPTAGITWDFDDCALNDSSGSDQNSWPGEGKVLLCVPTSDSQVGSWTGGAGGTTNLFAAVDNKPPTGTATETDTTQIENADGSPDNATDEYRANLQSYTTAGLPGGATITVLQAMCIHGEDVATSTKTGSIGINSNPAVGLFGFTVAADAGALGTFAASGANNWRNTYGTPAYNPSVTAGTSPVLALRKTDTGTRVVSVCAVGIYFEYTEATGLPPDGPKAILQATTRASVW